MRAWLTRMPTIASSKTVIDVGRGELALVPSAKIGQGSAPLIWIK